MTVYWDQKYRAEIEKRLVEQAQRIKELEAQLAEANNTIAIYRSEDRL